MIDKNDGSFMSLLLTLKENIMFNTNVAEVMIVKNIDSKYIYCSEINNDKHIYPCYKLKDLTVNENDCVLVLFTNTDFRLNLEKLKLGQEIQNGNERCEHKKDYAIIIGILHSNETNIENEGEE